MSKIDKYIAVFLAILATILLIIIILFVICREIDYNYFVYNLRELKAVITFFKIIAFFILCIVIFLVYLYFKY